MRNVREQFSLQQGVIDLASWQIDDFSLKANGKNELFARPTEFSFVRSWELITDAYTQAYPHIIYPLSNMAVAASIFMTVVLGLER